MKLSTATAIAMSVTAMIRAAPTPMDAMNPLAALKSLKDLPPVEIKGIPRMSLAKELATISPDNAARPVPQMRAEQETFEATPSEKMPTTVSALQFGALKPEQWATHMVRDASGIGMHRQPDAFRFWHNGKHVATAKLDNPWQVQSPIFSPTIDPNIKQKISANAQSIKDRLRAQAPEASSGVPQIAETLKKQVNTQSTSEQRAASNKVSTSAASSSETPANEVEFEALPPEVMPKMVTEEEYKDMDHSLWPDHMVDLEKNSGIGTHRQSNVFDFWHKGVHVATAERTHKPWTTRKPIFSPTIDPQIKKQIVRQLRNLKKKMKEDDASMTNQDRHMIAELEGDLLKQYISKQLGKQSAAKQHSSENGAAQQTSKHGKSQSQQSEWDEEAAMEERRKASEPRGASGSRAPSLRG